MAFLGVITIIIKYSNHIEFVQPGNWLWICEATTFLTDRINCSRKITVWDTEVMTWISRHHLRPFFKKSHHARGFSKNALKISFVTKENPSRFSAPVINDCFDHKLLLFLENYQSALNHSLTYYLKIRYQRNVFGTKIVTPQIDKKDDNFLFWRVNYVLAWKLLQLWFFIPIWKGQKVKLHFWIFTPKIQVLTRLFY